MKYSVFYHWVYGDFGKIISSGILISNENGRELKRIYDVSRDFDAVLRFTEQLNSLNADLPVFYDLLEDYYTGHC